MRFDRPHLKQPLQRDPVTGKLMCVEQGSADHITSQETSVVLCPVGFRDDRLDFGWKFPELSRTAPADPQPLVDALNRLVPGVSNRTAEAYADLVNDPSNWTIEVDSEVNPNA